MISLDEIVRAHGLTSLLLWQDSVARALD